MKFRNHRTFVSAAVLLTLLAVFNLAPLAAAEGAASGVVNVNQASKDELAMLPRVGPALAERIITYREENGGFQQTEDLILVRGIGEKTFALMEPYVAIKGETTLTGKVRVSRPATASAEDGR